MNNLAQVINDAFDDVRSIYDSSQEGTNVSVELGLRLAAEMVSSVICITEACLVNLKDQAKHLPVDIVAEPSEQKPQPK